MDKMVLKGVVGSPSAPSKDLLKEGGEEDLVQTQFTLSSMLQENVPEPAVQDPADVIAEIEEVPSSKTITVITDPSAVGCAEITLVVMAACQSLLIVPETGSVMGDPLETATMESSGFQLIR
jgi:hypothetical protein